MLPKDTGNAAQRRLIEEALAFRSLPDNCRGVAPTLKGLSGKWAADPQYAVKLASVANQILAHDLLDESGVHRPSMRCF